MSRGRNGASGGIISAEDFSSVSFESDMNIDIEDRIEVTRTKQDVPDEDLLRIGVREASVSPYSKQRIVGLPIRGCGSSNRESAWARPLS